LAAGFEKNSVFNITTHRHRLVAAMALPLLVAASANFLQHRRQQLADADVPVGSDVAHFRCPMCTLAEP